MCISRFDRHRIAIGWGTRFIASTFLGYGLPVLSDIAADVY